MSTRADVGRKLSSRLGRVGELLNQQLATEEREERIGIRAPNQPSEALTEIQRLLMRLPLTPDELVKVRMACGIDVLSDLFERRSDE